MCVLFCSCLSGADRGRQDDGGQRSLRDWATVLNRAKPSRKLGCVFRAGAFGFWQLELEELGEPKSNPRKVKTNKSDLSLLLYLIWFLEGSDCAEMKLLVLLWFFCLAFWLGSSEYEYVWDPSNCSCKVIPVDLRLCHGVGYPNMLLPNLLDHESMAEVKQQAVSWVPLVHRKCHHGTQVGTGAFQYVNLFRAVMGLETHFWPQF